MAGAFSSAFGSGFDVADSPYATEVLADSPVGYWRLDDTSGSTAVDSSGNGHNGTYRNSPTLNQTGLVQGDTNPAVNFNGSNQDVNLSNPTALRITSAWTLEAWVKIASGETAAASVIAYEYDGARVTYFLGFFDGSTTSLKPSCGFYNGSWHTVQAASAISVNAIHHIVGTWDGTDLKIYVDGSLANTATPGSSPSTGTGNFLLASRWDNAASPAKYKGILDEAAIYSTNIGATRIGVHYTVGTTSGDATATPSATAGTGAVPASTLTGTAITPSVVVAGVGAVPAPAAQGAGIAAPSATAGVGAVPAATAVGTAAGVATANVVPGIGAVPASTAFGGAAALPSATAATGAVPAPTPTGIAYASPAATNGIGSVPTAVAVGVVNATVTPGVVAGTSRVPHPYVVGAGTGGGGGSVDGVTDFWSIKALG